MKFHVTGSNKDTGARMTLEIVADSKAAAERKAANAGMIVGHAQVMPDAEHPEDIRHSQHRGEEEPDRSSKVIFVIALILVAGIAVGAWFFMEKLRQMLGGT